MAPSERRCSPPSTIEIESTPGRKAMGRVQRGEQRVRHYQQRAQRPRVKDFVLYAADLGLSAAIEWQPSAYSEHLVTALFATPVSYE
jgi:hypothetical protein